MLKSCNHKLDKFGGFHSRFTEFISRKNNLLKGKTNRSI